MLKRSITGFFIALVTVVFFLLRIFVDYRLLDLMIYIMAIIGAYEMATALGDRLTPLGKWLAVGFPVVVMPFVTFLQKFALNVALLYFSAVILICIFDKTDNAKSGEDNKELQLSRIGLTLLTMFYPTVPLICMQLANSTLGDLSLMSVIAVFMVAQLTDVFAYFVGSLLKGKKLIPEISPNKTISGAIGGLIGGIIGNFAAYYLSVWAGKTPFADNSTWVVVLFLVTSGIILSIVNQAGDLFESYIKRKVGIKDMGNIFPGHGGMLDRVDGLSFVSLVTFVLYSFLV